MTANVDGGGNPSSVLVVHADGWWQNSWGGLAPGDPDSYLTLDFAASHNVKVIRLSQYNGYQATNVEVRSSSDGVTFSLPLACTYSQTVGNAEIVLTPAVETRYLRVAATGYMDANRRWIVNNMRAFGDAGTLNPPRHDIDLVSSTGLSDGDGNGGTPTVAMTLIGAVSGAGSDGVTLDKWVDDAYTPLGRKILYNFDNGEGFTLGFDRVFLFSKFAFYTDPGYNDPNADYQVEVSMDNVAWGTPVLTQTSMPGGLKKLELTAKEGRYVRFTFTNTGVQTYINDVLVFGRIPPKAGTVIVIQ